MKYIKRSKKFIKYDYLNESMFYISKDFKEKLKRIDSPISKELLSVVYTDVKPDMTFIDTSDKEGFVEFSQIDKGMKYIESPIMYNTTTRKNLHYDLKSGEWTDEVEPNVYKKVKTNMSIPEDYFDNFNGMKARNKVKIGKLVNKIFPGKFKDKEIEEFVNKFKSKTSLLKNDFELVSGDEIPTWYHCDSYSSNKGTLGASCMRHMDEEVFDIYAENPNACRLLILKNNDDELLGRALVWKVEISNLDLERHPELEGLEYFMDRIYSIKDSDQNSFIEYAESKGWAYRSTQSYSYDNGLYYKGKFYQVRMRVKLEETEFDKYPYMDTFQSLDKSKNTLTNNDHGHILLDSTTGSLGEWSEYYEENIPEDDAIYSDQIYDWIWADRSVYIEKSISGKEGYYPGDHEDITFDPFSDMYIHKADAVYSAYSGENYYIENTLFVITDVNDYGEVVGESWVHQEEEDLIEMYKLEEYDWFEKVNDVKNWDDYNGIIDNLIIKDYKGDYIPQFLEVRSYDIAGEDNEEWLTLTDSYLLGKVKKEYDFNEMRETFPNRDESTFEYFERIWIKGDLDPFKYIDREYVSNLDYIKELDPYLVIRSIDALSDMVKLYKEFHEFENPENKK